MFKPIVKLIFLTLMFAPFATNAFAFDECDADRDCPTNYVCRATSGGSRACVWDSNSSCHGNGDCPSGSECISGTCSDGNPGDSCRGNGDCSTSYVCCSGRCEYSHCFTADFFDEDDVRFTPANPAQRRCQ